MAETTTILQVYFEHPRKTLHRKRDLPRFEQTVDHRDFFREHYPCPPGWEAIDRLELALASLDNRLTIRAFDSVSWDERFNEADLAASRDHFSGYHPNAIHWTDAQSERPLTDEEWLALGAAFQQYGQAAKWAEPGCWIDVRLLKQRNVR